MESPDQVIAAAAIAVSIELGVALEIPLIGKIMAAVGLVGIAVMEHKLKEELKEINNNLERLRTLTTYITKVIILAAVATSGVKAAEVIVKQFTYPVMWSKAIDSLYENSLINKINNLEGSLNEILRELDYAFSTALCSADDIYAKLESMVDDDALTYLKTEHRTPDSEHMLLFRDVADSIETAAGEIQNRQISLKEVKYINKALQEGVPQTEI